MKLRIGVVGLGNDWDTRYKPAFRALADRFEVRAICEPVALRADKAIRDFDACAVDGFQALSRRPDIDAIFVLSRGWYGELPVLAACNSGKSVYCTEGLDQDLETAASLKKRLESSGVTFLAEFPRRYAPATARLKELIATHLGQPKLMFCHSRVAAQRAGLNGRSASPQRSPMSHLIELADLCRYVMGADPSSVMGVAHGQENADFNGDYQMMSLEFPQPGNDGAVTTAQVSCGQYMPGDWPEAVTFRPPPEFQVACEKGIAFVDLPSTIIWFDKAGRHMESLDSERPVGELMLLQFYRCVMSLLHKPSGLEDAYRALNIVLAAQQSYRQGKRVTLGTDL
ncbi:MAG: Gfo/Idh/MocA family oxidoreductase [Pirellulales bacterium]|nr:Gfo/Idh/MocA family oxidoreductase [Pirellulales bacterium]